jgi:hypothetical protein
MDDQTGAERHRVLLIPDPWPLVAFGAGAARFVSVPDADGRVAGCRPSLGDVLEDRDDRVRTIGKR